MNKIVEVYGSVSRKLSAFVCAPSRDHAQMLLFVVGIALVSAGLAVFANAHTTNYNDLRMSMAVNAILTYIEGTFGAMIMVAAGIGAILSSAFGQYRAALGLLVVAVGAFILRSLVSTFFNDQSIQQ